MYYSYTLNEDVRMSYAANLNFPPSFWEELTVFYYFLNKDETNPISSNGLNIFWKRKGQCISVDFIFSQTKMCLKNNEFKDRVSWKFIFEGVRQVKVKRFPGINLPLKIKHLYLLNWYSIFTSTIKQVSFSDLLFLRCNQFELSRKICASYLMITIIIILTRCLGGCLWILGSSWKN